MISLTPDLVRKDSLIPWLYSMPVITDIKVKMIRLDGRYFPGLPPAIRVHDGFSKQQLMCVMCFLFLGYILRVSY